MPCAWINGVPAANEAAALAVTNRGMHYGDGLFETMLRARGQIRLLSRHLDRLEAGCERLHLQPPDRGALEHELGRLPSDGVVKLMIWRSGRGRGYRPDPSAASERLLLLYPPPACQPVVRVRWCRTRMARNPALAGLKHLNRLEQVLAQAELSDDTDEGLMLDTAGLLVSATMGNVFLVRDRALLTPRLDQCGVHGVMRDATLRAAAEQNLQVIEAELTRADVEMADEIFITNAVRGIRSVIRIEERELSVGPVTRALSASIEEL
jgi:4-amino-4-deoxychorismate lyase